MKLYLISLIIGIVLIMNGYHSIDLSVNSECLKDITLGGKMIDINMMYRIGLQQVFIGITLIMISIYNIGINHAKELNKHK